MSLGWLAFVVMALFALAPAAACPPPLGKAQWEALAAADDEDPFNYALMRWLKCGWNSAEPAMRDLRATVIAKARKDAAESGGDPDEHGEFVQRFVMILHLDPAVLDEADFFDMDEEPNPDDPAPLAELMRLRVPPATLASNFEDGFPGVIALLRREPLSDGDELMLELALVKQMARRGDIDAARARIDRLTRDAGARQASSSESERDSHYGEIKLLQMMQAAFEPASAKSAAADDSHWVLDRSSHRRRFCGTGAYMERLFGSSALRESVLKAGDADAAIGELLVQHWREHLLGGVPQAPLLIELLRKRHGEAGLRQGWEDGIATLRDGEVPAIHLFGHYLPLPNLVREDDSAVPGTTRERRLSCEELVALVKASSLYRLSLGKTAFAD